MSLKPLETILRFEHALSASDCELAHCPAGGQGQAPVSFKGVDGLDVSTWMARLVRSQPEHLEDTERLTSNGPYFEVTRLYLAPISLVCVALSDPLRFYKSVT